MQKPPCKTYFLSAQGESETKKLSSSRTSISGLHLSPSATLTGPAGLRPTQRAVLPENKTDGAYVASGIKFHLWAGSGLQKTAGVQNPVYAVIYTCLFTVT